MNVLVFDDPPAVGHLVRSALAGHHHRASISTTAADAILKLQTGLFDAVILGAAGAPLEVADFLENERPDLPIILAGVANAVPVEGPIAAVLVAPLRLSDLVRCINKLERIIHSARAESTVDLVLGDRHLVCRILRREHDRVLVEHDPCDFAGVESASLCRASETDPVNAPAHVLFADGARLLGLRIDTEELAEKLIAV